MALLRIIDQFKNVPVRSIRTAQIVGTVLEPILDPGKLQVVAFVCEPRLSPDPLILMTQDIREVNRLGVIINSEDELVPLDEIVRLQEIAEQKFKLIGKHVETEQKQKVGKVSTYVVDDQSFMVQKLYVNQSILKSLNAANRVIGRQQIVEIQPKTIIVRDTDLREPVAKGAPVMLTPPAN